ncbi:MAG TPA: MarR family transcriptional regulator [Thermoplasmata archaeon]|nr:MarR family transcriptional regulator [Thermoplasmata archaeon]
MPRPTASPATVRLVDALETVVQGMIRIARREATAAGLSMPQFFVLRRIRRGGALPATQWAKHVGTRASSASGLVDGLVRNGWVLRARDPADRRKVLIRLSPRGARLVERVDDARRRRIRAVLAELAPREVERAAAMAEDLARRFSALGGAGSPSAKGSTHENRAPPRTPDAGHDSGRTRGATRA